jgi:S1-C subfamily serine protease
LKARAGLTGALCLAATSLLGGCASQPSGFAEVPASPAAAPAAPVALNPAQIAALATPSIVSIRGQRSMGTGFIVRKNGWIATNFHVVRGQTALVVTIPERGELPVREVIAVDAEHDIAIVRVDANDLPVLRLGNSRRVRAGDPVVAIGHPLGLEDTISNGLVSAVRKIDDSLTIFQISAPIAPGSSGGPLIDDQGRVIGISTATVARGQNINFGMPVAYLKEALARPRPVAFSAFAEGQAVSEPKRDVPRFELAILAGCGEGDRMLLSALMNQAIRESGEPYEQGDFAATYGVLAGATLDAARRIGPTCTGPRRVLHEARQAATRVADPKERAWTLHDGVMGLLDVLGRRLNPEG